MIKPLHPTARRASFLGTAIVLCIGAFDPPVHASGSPPGDQGSAAASATAPPHPLTPNPASIDWVSIRGFQIARTETTIGQFRRHVEAARIRTLAEQRGGGQVYEMGWTQKPGWIWSAPYGPSYRAGEDEPVAHVTWHEAQAFCRWAGGRIPTDEEWRLAAYTETRPNPPSPFVVGRHYLYPTGDRPDGAQCLDQCGEQARNRAVPHGARLLRGFGHARTSQTPAGVNGLHDMGANLWEWVDDPVGASGNADRLTRGGSWWYGSGPMRIDHRQTKPADTAVVYIGFRCARSD